MANTKSARKRAAKSEEQRKKNRAVRSQMRTAVKKARRAIATEGDDSTSLVAEAIAIVDSTARKGIVHSNAAARTKSRLTAAVRKASTK